MALSGLRTSWVIWAEMRPTAASRSARRSSRCCASSEAAMALNSRASTAISSLPAASTWRDRSPAATALTPSVSRSMGESRRRAKSAAATPTISAMAE